MENFSAFKLYQKASIIKEYLPKFKLISFELTANVLILFFTPRKTFTCSHVTFSNRKKYSVQIVADRKTAYCSELRQYLDWNGSLDVRKVLVEKLRKLVD